jgi:hypothetical protein
MYIADGGLVDGIIEIEGDKKINQQISMVVQKFNILMNNHNNNL